MPFDYAQDYKQKGFASVIILVGLLVIAAVASGAYFLGKSNKSEPIKVVSQPQITPQPTALPTSLPQASASGDMTNWKTYTSNLIGIELKFPSAWTVSEKDEKVNKYIEISSPSGETKLSVFKNYIGGAAGFKQYKDNKDIQIMEINTIKSYFTEDTEAQNVSMFINLNLSKDKYLLIGKWKINDADSESLIDQILSTFRFIN